MKLMNVRGFTGRVFLLVAGLVAGGAPVLCEELPAGVSSSPADFTTLPIVQNQPVVISSFKEVEMERLRIAEEIAKAERDEAEFQKQIAILQKKLADASASAILPESLPSDYRAFLSAGASEIARSESYYSELKSVLNALVPDSPYRARSSRDSTNALQASERLIKLSEYPEDDDICRSIRGHIGALTGGRIDDIRRQQELQRELQKWYSERRRLEWNLKMAHKPNALTGETATEDERNYIREQIGDVKEKIARCEDEKNSLSHRVTAEVRKLQFQQFIVELAVQQRYVHALIACGFYRNSFRGADLTLSEEAYPATSRSKSKDPQEDSTPASGTVPSQLPVISTITGMEAFLLNRIRDSVKDRESVENMLRENQIGAAESLLRKMILTAKYQPELQTLPYASRQKILAGGQTIKRISDAVNAKDYEEINRLVAELESQGADTGLADLRVFAAEHPRKAMHWARQAELAMKVGDIKSMNSLMEYSVRRAPLDQSVKEKIELIQESAVGDHELSEDLKRIVESSDYRSAFDRINEFGPLAQGKNSDPELQAAYEALLELEKDLRSAVEKADAMERRGAHPDAWMEIHSLKDPIRNDSRVVERKSRLAGKCPKFVNAHTKALENENAGCPAKALAWYLNALSESPSNEDLIAKVHSLGIGLLED
jgi:hypothetical protein